MQVKNRVYENMHVSQEQAAMMVVPALENPMSTSVSEGSTEQLRARAVAEQAERALKRNQVRQEAYTVEQMKEIIKSSPGFSAPAPIAKSLVADEANFVDWSNIEDDQYRRH